jgi:hypothetical protein
MSEVYQHQSATRTGVGWPVAPPTGTPFPVTQIGDMPKTSLEIIVDTIVVDHTARILDLEKQVAELRALLATKEARR